MTADPLLIDTSALARLGTPHLAAARRDEVADAFVDGRVAICTPVLLEAGFSARDARAHARLFDDLLELPFLELDTAVERRARAAQAQLAQVGHHRLPPTDLLVAAVAERHGHAVLHYDRDYDVLADRTDLRFRSVWLAARGALP